jgi:hypothetical protein
VFLCYDYQRVNAGGDSEYGTPEGDEYSLPVREIAPVDSDIKPANAITPPALKQYIGPDLDQKNGERNMANDKKPLSVRVIGDGELSLFERKTVRFGYWGVVIGGLSLLAACAATYLVFQQFKEIAKQTDLLGMAARQARIDSNENGKATAKQLSILQGQLTQQRQALEVDQRPWLKFEIGDPPNGSGLVYAFPSAGKPLKIPVRITNIGKTAAEKIKGVLFVQVIHIGNEPILPERKLIFTMPGEKQPKGESYPSEGWVKGVMYPGEMDQGYYSRLKRGPAGVGVEDPVTQAELDDVGNGRAHIYILGEVWYYDIFGVAHWTKFCQGDTFERLPTALKCAHFNSVDNE